MQALGLTWKRLATKASDSSFMAGYLRRLHNTLFSSKYLLYTNVSVSVSLSALGDFLEQKYELYKGTEDKYDYKRTMHMGCSGAAVGVLCHNWYKVLDRFIQGKTVSMVFKKLVLDQLVFSPVMICTFFGSLALFEENPVENFRDEVTDKFLTLYRAEWMVWPPAQIINFYYLPTRYRVLYDNFISLGYDVYTSQVKHNKS
ncbi:mpv17-like protein 2 [Plodia interpunctella]|uniref:mpv17-like protein 2 n=1 Tax=Plodia interpunctella TaxID=58824 RepID=UPI0023674E5B|nr:mpv17-like protein 2 [Plodia interpunctella]XP_053606235.1 mpv17-like protein 2 [Plodia interpunctella]